MRRSARASVLNALLIVALVGPAWADPPSFRQITVGAAPSEAVLSGDGSVVAFESTADPTGGNPSHFPLVFTVDADSTDLRQMPAPEPDAACGTRPVPTAENPTLSDDGMLVAYQVLTGTSCGPSTHAIAVPYPDGTGLSTPFGAYTLNQNPSVSGDGTRIAYVDLWAGSVWVGDPTGLAFSSFVYASGCASSGIRPVIAHDASRVFIRNECQGGRLRVADVNVGLPQRAPLPDVAVLEFDVNDDGSRILFVSSDDPLGTNLDRSAELFLWNASGELRQLTASNAGVSLPSIDGAGTRGVFRFNADGDGYAIDLETGTIERVVDVAFGRTIRGLDLSRHGSTLLVLTDDDLAGTNPGHATELFIANLGEPSSPSSMDADDDGVRDETDNCPFVRNGNQEDADGDGSGDACDVQDGVSPGAPKLTKVEPAKVPPGHTVSLSGDRLGGAPGVILVGSLRAEILIWTDQFIKARVPNLAPGSYPISVATDGGVASRSLEVLGLAPAITRVEPKSAPMRAVASIEGANFGEQQGSSSVTVGGASAQVLAWSSTRIGVRVPTVGKGTHAVVVQTDRGHAAGKLRVRDLFVQMERGECDASYLGTLAGTCWVLDADVKRQREDAGLTKVDLEVKNIRRRWYEVTGALGGSFMLGPDGRGAIGKRLLTDVPVVPGTSVVLFADGTSVKALGLHALDLILIAATGKPLPMTNLDRALRVLSAESCLAGFGATIGTHLAQLDLMAVVGDLRGLPKLASDDRCARDALRSLGVSDAKLAQLGDASRVIKLVSIITKELESLSAPQFDSMSVVGE